MAAFSLELAPWCRHSLLLKGEGAPRCSSGGCLGGLLTEILEGACLARAAPQGITRLTVYRAHGTICALCRVSALLVPFVGAPWCASAPTNEALAAGSLNTGGRSLYYMPAMFSAFFAPPAQKNADNLAGI